jgi:hypothetical protein
MEPKSLQTNRLLAPLAFIASVVVGIAPIQTPQADGVLIPGNNVLLQCLGHLPGPRYLVRRMGGTVGLATDADGRTTWRVIRATGGGVALRCLGISDSLPWLDGRTADGSVGLAPHTNYPFTGTRWQVISADANDPTIVALKCLGHLPGPRWLDGRTVNGTVGLASTTEPPFTRWEVRARPAPDQTHANGHQDRRMLLPNQPRGDIRSPLNKTKQLPCNARRPRTVIAFSSAVHPPSCRSM